MAQEWDIHCNKKAYGQDGGYKDNREEVEFMGGRTISYGKNSKAIKTHALNFTFDDTKLIDGKTEFQWFLFWCEVTLRNINESFYFINIITRKGQRTYKIKEWPTWTGQGKKEVSCVFVEA